MSRPRRAKTTMTSTWTAPSLDALLARIAPCLHLHEGAKRSGQCENLAAQMHERNDEIAVRRPQSDQTYDLNPTCSAWAMPRGAHSGKHYARILQLLSPAPSRGVGVGVFPYKATTTAVQASGLATTATTAPAPRRQSAGAAAAAAVREASRAGRHRGHGSSGGGWWWRCAPPALQPAPRA